MPPPRSFHANTAEDTEAFGARLARARPQRDGELAVVHLTGDLGAGKTTLVRGFLRAHGIKGPVRSPTYTLLELYETGPSTGTDPSPLTLVHVDLYRLRDPSELDHLGLREWAKPRHVWLIEWPERGATRLPPPDLFVRLTAGELGHDIEVAAQTFTGEEWLSGL